MIDECTKILKRSHNCHYNRLSNYDGLVDSIDKELEDIRGNLLYDLMQNTKMKAFSKDVVALREKYFG